MLSFRRWFVRMTLLCCSWPNIVNHVSRRTLGRRTEGTSTAVLSLSGPGCAASQPRSQGRALLLPAQHQRHTLTQPGGRAGGRAHLGKRRCNEAGLGSAPCCVPARTAANRAYSPWSITGLKCLGNFVGHLWTVVAQVGTRRRGTRSFSLVINPAPPRGTSRAPANPLASHDGRHDTPPVALRTACMPCPRPRRSPTAPSATRPGRHDAAVFSPSARSIAPTTTACNPSHL
jgi:hypothetical protein